MRFADFHVGQVIEAGPHAVSEDELRGFVERWDPQWFHCDTRAAADGVFGGLIASGWHTCSIAMRLVVQGVGARLSHGFDRAWTPGEERRGQMVVIGQTGLDRDAIVAGIAG